ncbi:MAG: hypothetical protein JWN31_643, partial [Frankiales bacterium]|nr:hypothetical protein [Frankiales bacterium]
LAQSNEAPVAFDVPAPRTDGS